MISACDYENEAAVLPGPCQIKNNLVGRNRIRRKVVAEFTVKMIRSLSGKSYLSVSSALQTTLVFTSIRTICCTSTLLKSGEVGEKNIRPVRHLGHHNHCPSDRILPKLIDVCVWKPPTRYCLPSWCHPHHGHISTSHFCKRCYMTEEELLKDPNCEVDDLRRKMDDNKAYVIDVRKLEELEESGKIPGAVHVPREYERDSLFNLLIKHVFVAQSVSAFDC